MYWFCLYRTHFQRNIWRFLENVQPKLLIYELLELSEEAEKPADLNQKIVFKAKKKEKTDAIEENQPAEKSASSSKRTEKSKRKKGKPTKSLLSFGEEEDDDEGYI